MEKWALGVGMVLQSCAKTRGPGFVAPVSVTYTSHHPRKGIDSAETASYTEGNS